MNTKTKKIIIANWKMNPLTIKEAEALGKETNRAAQKNIETVVCPPAPFLGVVGKTLKSKSISLGAQNVYGEKSGAFTGEISVPMLKSFGVAVTIVGHSERRALGENDQDVASKVKALVAGGITPVLCIGEHTRDDGGAYLEVLKNQLLQSLSGIAAAAVKKVVIAYEPIWAIGKTGDDAITGRHLHEIVIFIRKVLVDTYGKSNKDVRIIYGGAVAPENAHELIAEGMVDGLLVGHLSLKPKQFSQILASTAALK